MHEAFGDYVGAYLRQQGVADAEARARAVTPVLASLVQGYLLQRGVGADLEAARYAASLRLALAGDLA